MGRATAFGTALLLAAAALSSSALASGTPDLEVFVAASAAAVGSGSSLNYFVSVSNLSATDSATNVKIVDTLPTGTTFQSASAGCAHVSGVVTCTAATLATNTSKTFQIDVTIPTTSGPPASSLVDITNTATVSADEPDPNAANNTKSIQTRVYPVTDLAVTKTGPATATPGSQIAFAITVTNRGPSPATWVLVYDPLPAGTTAVGNGMTSPDSIICGIEIPSQQFPNNPHVGEYGCRFTSIPVGGTVSMTFTVRVGSGAATVSNTATAYAGFNPLESADTDPDLTNNSATATVAVAQSADLAATFALPFPLTVKTNDQLTYRPVVTNFGPSTATNVVVTQDLPPNVTLISKPPFCLGTQQLICAIGDLPGGLSAQPFQVVVQAPATAGTISSRVSVTSDTPDPNPANNSDTGVTSVVAPTADMSLVKVGGPSRTGVPSTYTITAHNAGPDNATSVVVTDPFIAGVSFATASARVGTTSQPCTIGGGQVTCRAPALAVGDDLIVTIEATASSAGPVTNTATASADEADPNLGNNTATQMMLVRGTVDLAVAKSELGGAAHVEGATLGYRLDVSNAGPDVAQDTRVTDTLPPGTSYAGGPALCVPSGAIITCSFGSVAPGAAVSATVSVRVNTTGAITNTATVTTSDVDTNPANDTASVTTTIIRATDLSVTETAARGAGGTAVFTTVLTNSGPSTSNGAVALNTLPAGATAPSISSPAGVFCAKETVGPYAGQYGCRFGAIAAGASVTMSFSFQPPAGAAATSSKVTAYPGTGEFDLNGANDSATVTLALDNTPAGTNVPVTPTDTTTGTTPVSITFANVTSPGTTTLTTSPAGPPPPAGFTGFQLGTTYYDVHTTATFAGMARVCITDASVTAATRLFHYETNPTPPPPQIWVDRTVLPVTPPTICADVTSFSLFAAFTDTTPPTITITRPTGTYALGETVLASYACADAGTGVATCTGTKPNGGAIDTGSLGTKTFTVDATDGAGNTSHQSVTYTVTYRICALPRQDGDDGNRVFVRICDAAGRNLSSPAIALTAVGVDGGGLPAGKEPAPTAFRFVPGLNAYTYRVPTQGLTPGTHTLRFTVAGDPAVHTVAFTVRADDDGDRD